MTPMLTMSHECPECGTILNKAEDQATDKEITEVRQAISGADDPVQHRPLSQCSLCGNWYHPLSKG